MNYQQAAFPPARPLANPTSYQYGHPGMYGTSGPTIISGAPMSQQHQKGPFVRGLRQRLNFVAILTSLFVPWLLFCIVYWAMSFSLHYQNPFICYCIVFLGLCVVIAIALFAVDAMKRKRGGNPLFVDNGVRSHEPTWLVFLAATCFLAWLLGFIGGDLNYWRHMEPYYDMINLNTYPNVDPSVMRGQQLMDAGRISFSEGSSLDLSRSMGFKNLDLYCVAPIVSGEDPKHISSYDFWAVGLNCCSGSRADFHCGEFNNPRAGAGLRLMRDDQHAFYRLAVQQAEAAYNIKSHHPLFFMWMHDPIAAVAAYMDDGYKYFFISIFTHFVFQLFLVICACLVFSKMGTLG